MHDIILVNGLGDSLFQSLGFVKVLAKIEADKSNEVVRRQASIAALLYHSLNPGAVVEQTAGLVLGVLFSEYGTTGEADGHTAAIAWLRDYWAKERDPALSDVIVATACRVIRNLSHNEHFDLMDIVAADARLLSTVLSDRVKTLQQGAAPTKPSNMRARTVVGQRMLASLQQEISRQNSQYIVRSRRNLFQFFPTEHGIRAHSVSFWYNTIDNVIVGGQVEYDLTDYALELIDGRVLMVPNAFLATLTNELSDYMIQQDHRFSSIREISPSSWMTPAFWKTDALLGAAVAHWVGKPTLYWFTKTSHYNIHQTEVGERFFVTLKGEPHVAYSLGDHEDEHEHAACLNTVSDTPAIPAGVLIWLTNWLYKGHMEIQRKKNRSIWDRLIDPVAFR